MKTKTLISLLTLACLLAVPATAQVNYAVSGSTAYVTRSPNASGDIVIASTYNGFPVTSIGNAAFYNCTNLTSVTIPNSVTSIGSTAFRYCTSLTSVTIPSSVTSIGFGAFQYCGSLTTMTIPNSVTSIGDQVFYSCTSLTSVTIPNSVTSIGIWAFISCTSLTSVTIGNSVTSIGYQAFRDCTSLTSVTIPNSVTNIGGRAFEYCTSLTSLTFLGNAPTEGFSMFANVGPGATVYYYYGTTGWGATYGGLPTVMLYPPPQVSTGSAGVQPGGFGFTITGVVNQTIVVEGSTNLTNWQSIWTNTLSAVSTNFVDPQWLDHPRRFYRLRSN